MYFNSFLLHSGARGHWSAYAEPKPTVTGRRQVGVHTFNHIISPKLGKICDTELCNSYSSNCTPTVPRSSETVPDYGARHHDDGALKSDTSLFRASAINRKSAVDLRLRSCGADTLLESRVKHPKENRHVSNLSQNNGRLLSFLILCGDIAHSDRYIKFLLCFAASLPAIK